MKWRRMPERHRLTAASARMMAQSVLFQ
jgi:hypothetical protein